MDQQDIMTDNYGWGDGTNDLKQHRYTISAVLRAIRNYEPERVLDLGCGDGAIANAISTCGMTVVGAEPSQSGCAAAASRYPHIPFHQLGCYDDPADLQEEQFDFVVSCEVIEHLFFPGKLLSFAREVLAPGGKILIVCPYHGYLKNLIISVLGQWDQQHSSLIDGMHIKFWSFRTLRQLLDNHGFRVLEESGCGRIRYLWNCMVVVAEKT
jgi:2-polyprenyl-3-methyl-5-hydroxy-6-metoxy-1,4-benzoquinol methylase